jgi:acetyl-CoA synthetase
MNDQYAQLYRSYRWSVPSQFNIAQACAHRWAENPLEGRRVAIYHEDEAGLPAVWTYSRLSQTANQLANGLTRMGVLTGDRVAVIMDQRPEAVVACIAIVSMGAIAVPLSYELSAPDLAARLRDAGARVAIIDAAGGLSWLTVAARCPAVTQIVALNFPHETTITWKGLLARQPDTFKPALTPSNLAALLLYPTSGGATPKGVLLAHATLIGYLPGFVASQDWFPQSSDILWGGTDWTSGTGMLGALLPTLFFGRAIVASVGSMPGSRLFELLARYAVTNIFVSSIEIGKLIGQVFAPRQYYRLPLRALATTGPTMDANTTTWCEEQLGVTPNAVFGQPEVGYVIGNSYKKWPIRQGSLGRLYPGHRGAVLNANGAPVDADIEGDIAVNRRDIHGYPDPALFLGYWHDDAATVAKYAGPTGEWYLTGERGRVDRDGYFWRTSPLE